MSETEKPLAGRRIVITRNQESGGRLASRLQALGADTMELPLIRIIHEVDQVTAGDIFLEIGHYEWLVFTSVNGVRGFFECFFKAFDDIRSLGFIKIAVIGKATAAALSEWYIKPELIAHIASADSLAKSLSADRTIDNERILVVTGNLNRATLVKELEAERAIVDTLQVYKTELVDLSENEVAAEFRAKGADALIFASSSAVESFGQQASHLKLSKGATVPALCSFGPQTSATMKAAGIPLGLEAKEPSMDALVEALVAHFNGGSK